jgi:SAM-dependent methyltransferase
MAIYNLIFTFFFSNSAQAHLCDRAFFAQTQNEMQSMIEQTKKDLEDNDRFITRRSLRDYIDVFQTQENPYYFQELLSNLPQSATWFDMGAGHGKALLDALFFSNHAHIKNFVGVSYEAPKSESLSQASSRHQGRFHYIETGFLENHWHKNQLSESFAPWNNKVDLITDYFGPMSYTFDLSKVLKIYLNLLKLNGRVLLQLSFVKNPEKSLEQDLFFNRSGAEESDFRSALEQIFENITGTQTKIEMISRSDFNGIERETFRIELKKVSHEFEVPLIKTLHFFSHRPVRRHLQFEP